MRILLKVSGESLSGEGKKGYDPDMVGHLVEEIGDLVRSGFEVGLVLGAGNLVRGKDLKEIDRASADYIGMLGTVMNSIYLSSELKKAGLESVVFSNMVEVPIVRRMNYEEMNEVLKRGGVVLFGGGTTNPMFTTDTAAALRAFEMGARRILKATKVDGVYDKDPKIHPDARRFDVLSFEKALEMGLEIMDPEAFSLCMRFGLEVVVFDFFKRGNTLKAARGEIGTLVRRGGDL